jgi:colanic acid/amylovoran biosynthesis glycosyltransferase
MKSIAIVTNSFPYPPGEQFIETEIKFWQETPFEQVLLLPARSSGQPRAVPSCINVETILSPNKSALHYAFKAVFSQCLRAEIRYLILSKKLSLITILIALKSVTLYVKAEEKLFEWLKQHGPLDTIYCYWNEYFSYAACKAKKYGMINTVVSRIHRYDLYEERRQNSYMPLKRQFIKNLDCLFVLSSKASSYCQTTYGISAHQCQIMPLGVEIPPESYWQEDVNRFSVVSVSFCNPVKRIDKIIKGIAIFARSSPHLHVQWIHIGDGPLRKNLQQFAQKEFQGCKNIDFCLKGHFSNEDVCSFYTTNTVNCFVNTSDSEGMPVSIMEAMAAGIPIIAPDIGGIHELVEKENGVLLPSDPQSADVAQALQFIADHPKINSLRDASRQKTIINFNANVNYRKLINRIAELSENIQCLEERSINKPL